ncbi:unnamed protein product [Effrenium voratum]|nr:unnamed protein product [Effrenium voratum]
MSWSGRAMNRTRSHSLQTKQLPCEARFLRAAAGGQWHVLLHLLDLEQGDLTTDSAAHAFVLAAAARQLECLEQFLAKGMNLQCWGVKKAMVEAAARSSMDVLKLLVSHQADLTGWAADKSVIVAAEREHMEVVRFLVESGVDVSQGVGDMVMEAAAAKNDVALLQLLLDKAAHFQSVAGERALASAARCRSWEAVHFLTLVDVELESWSGHIALLAAARTKNTFIMHILQRAGLDMSSERSRLTLWASTLCGQRKNLGHCVRPPGSKYPSPGDEFRTLACRTKTKMAIAKSKVVEAGREHDAAATPSTLDRNSLRMHDCEVAEELEEIATACEYPSYRTTFGPESVSFPPQSSPRTFPLCDGARDLPQPAFRKSVPQVGVAGVPDETTRSWMARVPSQELYFMYLLGNMSGRQPTEDSTLQVPSQEQTAAFAGNPDTHHNAQPHAATAGPPEATVTRSQLHEDQGGPNVAQADAPLQLAPQVAEAVEAADSTEVAAASAIAGPPEATVTRSQLHEDLGGPNVAQADAALAEPFSPFGRAEQVQLQLAASKGDKDLLLHLLAARAELPGGGVTPLHLAAQCGHTKIVEALLAAGHPPDAEMGGFTPLHDAVQHGYKDVVALLLRASAADRGALHIAARVGNSQACKLLPSKRVQHDGTFRQCAAVRRH